MAECSTSRPPIVGLADSAPTISASRNRMKYEAVHISSTQPSLQFHPDLPGKRTKKS